MVYCLRRQNVYLQFKAVWLLTRSLRSTDAPHVAEIFTRYYPTSMLNLDPPRELV